MERETVSQLFYIIYKSHFQEFSLEIPTTEEMVPVKYVFKMCVCLVDWPFKLAFI